MLGKESNGQRTFFLQLGSVSLGYVRFGAVCVTVVQVAGEGGMGDDEVVEVGVLLECWKISSSRCECPGGEVATSVWAAQTHRRRRSVEQKRKRVSRATDFLHSKLQHHF